MRNVWTLWSETAVLVLILGRQLELTKVYRTSGALHSASNFDPALTLQTNGCHPNLWTYIRFLSHKTYSSRQLRPILVMWDVLFVTALDFRHQSARTRRRLWSIAADRKPESKCYQARYAVRGVANENLQTRYKTGVFCCHARAYSLFHTRGTIHAKQSCRINHSKKMHVVAGNKKVAKHCQYQMRIGLVKIIAVWLGSALLPFMAGQWLSLHPLSCVLKPLTMIRIAMHRWMDVETWNLAPSSLLTATAMRVKIEPNGSTNHCQDCPEGNLKEKCLADNAGAFFTQKANHDGTSARHVVGETNLSRFEHCEYSGLKHLLVDFEHVDQEFLSSEELLAEAMVQLLESNSWKMRSSHCHHSEHAGVSCVAITTESRISLRSFPSFGMLAIDLITCGNKTFLQSVIPYIEELFGLHGKTVEQEAPRIVWRLKQRWPGKNRNQQKIGIHYAKGRTDNEHVFLGAETTGVRNIQIVEKHHSTKLDMMLDHYGVIQAETRGQTAYH